MPSPTPTPTTLPTSGFTIDTSVLNTPIDHPSLDDCLATSAPPSLELEAEDSAGALGSALEVSAKRRKSQDIASPTSLLEIESAQTSAVFDIEMVNAEDSPALPVRRRLRIGAMRGRGHWV
ncbi:uncharacterized protein M421DRAFT_418657, partial [Didymella exigua CBS 183.55]